MGNTNLMARRLTKWIEGESRENHDEDECTGWKNGSRSCMEKLAMLEDMLERWHIANLPMEELDKWHERMVWHVRRVNEYDYISRAGVSCKRMKELVDADTEGKIVILPCKIGDPVYSSDFGCCEHRLMDQCGVYCDGFDQWKSCWEGDIGVNIELFTLSLLPMLGKTVFLTEEEAKSALERMKENE